MGQKLVMKCLSSIAQISDQEEELRNQILPAISVKNISQSSIIAVTSDGELVSPEGTQEGNKEYLPSSRHQTTATLEVEP